MLKRILLLLLLALAVAGSAWADGGTDNDVDVTATSQTIIFSEQDSGKSPYIASSVLIRIPSTNTNEVYFWLFTDAQYRGDEIGIACGGGVTSAACVRSATTSDRVLKPADRSIEIVFDPVTEGGYGYVAISIVCAAAETSDDIVVDWK